VLCKFQTISFKKPSCICSFYSRAQAREASIFDYVVKPKKQNTHNQRQQNHRQQTSDVNDNDLVREMHQKLKGRNLRDY
jgi:hypothetical protein